MSGAAHALAMIALCVARDICAQSSGSAAATSTRNSSAPAAATGRAMRSLDTWIATKFRGAQLLPDSVRSPKVSSASASSPRVEVVRSARSGDTLLALQFASKDAPPLRSANVVRLADPSGSVTLLSARIIARRPFRAPRIPNASVDSDLSWRVGWAYAAVVQSSPRSTRVRAERAWLLVDAADSTTRRVAR